MGGIVRRFLEPAREPCYAPPRSGRRHDFSLRPIRGARLRRPRLRHARRGRAVVRRSPRLGDAGDHASSRRGATPTPTRTWSAGSSSRDRASRAGCTASGTAGATFKVRFVATAPGEWRWRSGSNQPDDAGLNGGRGRLARGGVDRGREAGEPQPPRLRARHARTGTRSQHADGTPFFLVGDTWLAASTWRLPWQGRPARAGLRARPPASASRRPWPTASARASTPSASSPRSPTGMPITTAPRSRTRTASTCATPGRSSGTGRRTPASPRPTAPLTTAKDMADEHGNRPFEVLADREGLADFDRLEPRLLPQPRPQDAAPGRRRASCPSWRPSVGTARPVLEGLLRLQRVLRPLRPVPDRPLRGVQPRSSAASTWTGSRRTTASPPTSSTPRSPITTRSTGRCRSDSRTRR